MKIINVGEVVFRISNREDGKVDLTLSCNHSQMALSMTKEQCSTLGDILKIIATGK